ncbi:hypothetical protein [Methylobacterium sp. D48H]
MRNIFTVPLFTSAVSSLTMLYSAGAQAQPLNGSYATWLTFPVSNAGTISISEMSNSPYFYYANGKFFISDHGSGGRSNNVGGVSLSSGQRKCGVDRRFGLKHCYTGRVESGGLYFKAEYINDSGALQEAIELRVTADGSQKCQVNYATLYRKDPLFMGTRGYDFASSTFRQDECLWNPGITSIH